MRRTFLTAVVLVAIAFPIYADEDFCFLVVRVAAAGKLRDYSDKQIENGLCMTTKEMALAIAAGDSVKQQICTEASTNMMREFKTRFPRRDPSVVAGKC